MKKIFKDPFLIILVTGVLVTGGLLLVFVKKFHRLNTHVQELVELKQDYANYRLALKRLIVEQSDAKKKKGTDGPEFLTVNRDFSRLRRAAFSHARKYALERSVMDLYGPRAGKAVVDRRREERALAYRRARLVRERSQLLVVDQNLQAARMEHSFIYPLKSGSFRLTSRFGPRRRSNGQWGFHKGLDMAAPRGTPVKAAGGGVVVEARNAGGFGNMVIISHSNKVKTRYAHLSKIEVSVGDSVQQGDRIGRVGNTGHTRGKNGIHLHFEVLVYGKPVNPLYFL